MRNVDKLTHTVRKNHEPFAQGWYYGHYQETLWHKIVTTLHEFPLVKWEIAKEKEKKRKERVISFYPECFIASSVSG